MLPMDTGLTSRLFWRTLNPWFVGLLSAVLPLGQSIGIFALIAYGLLVVAALLLPETKGRGLTAE
jgi:hypothetical protein